VCRATLKASWAIALAAETSITSGTWQAARASVDVALTAQAHLSDGGRAAFALCRPPGHHDASDKIKDCAPDALVVSLGVDTFERDPISFFKLSSSDFIRYGGVIAKLGLPTLFVMEGGYAVEEIGINAVNVLLGFEGV
jgi:acetoin utilization deacetylase AcuC-like enzyme